MIEVKTIEMGRLTRQLSDQAARLARVAAENSRRARDNDPTRWRRPDLLWPLF